MNNENSFVAQDFIRKTASYNPIEHMIPIKYEESDPTPVLYLTVPQRLDWFQHWAEENNHRFRIDESQYEIRESLKLVIATCVIYLDGEEVSRATASREYTLSNGTREVSNAVQTAFTFAKGRALSDLGFGTVNGNASETGELYPPDAGIPIVTADTNPMISAASAIPAAPAPKPADRAKDTASKIPSTIEEARDYIIPCGQFKGESIGTVWGRGGKDAGAIRWFLGDEFSSKSKYPALIAACRLVVESAVA